jgi:oxygen-dependent protoporphyrinogen oxidase
MSETRDIVIVGGGIAGLVAADRLRAYDPLVLEADSRAGGRVLSHRRGDLALSLGAHMFPGPESVIGELCRRFDLETMPIGGSMLNVFLKGRLVRDVRPELMPLRLPLSASGRIALARAGLRLKRDADRYMRLIRPRPGDTETDVRLRALRHRGDETYAQFLGPLPPDAEAVFRAVANRSIAEPDEIAQSSMSALFGHVWDTGDLGRNLRGGSGRLPEALAGSLGGSIALDAPVRSVRLSGDHVFVRHGDGSAEDELRARRAILAIPAPQILEIAPELPVRTRAALRSVRYGPMVVLSIHTTESQPMPWDDLYSILTPDMRFNMFFNHANFAHTGGLRKQGSVLMVYGGGGRARALWELGDDQIRDRFLADLDRIYPQLRPLIAETMARKWPYAGPFATPGRWRAQRTIEAGVEGRVFFAGDWVSEFVSMETAARSAIDAAAQVHASLGTAVAAAG